MKALLVLKGLGALAMAGGILLSLVTLFSPVGHGGNLRPLSTTRTLSVTVAGCGKTLVFLDGVEVKDPIVKQVLLTQAGEEIRRIAGKSFSQTEAFAPACCPHDAASRGRKWPRRQPA